MSSTFSCWSDPNYLENWFGPLRKAPESVVAPNSPFCQNQAEEPLPTQEESPPQVLQEKKIIESAKAVLPKPRKYEKKDPVVIPQVKPISEDRFKALCPQKKNDTNSLKPSNTVIILPIAQSREKNPQPTEQPPKNVLKPVVNSVAIETLNPTKKRVYVKASPKGKVIDVKTEEFTQKSPPFKKNDTKTAKLQPRVEIKKQSEQKDAASEPSLQICLDKETPQASKIISLENFEPHLYTREELIFFYLSPDFEPLLRQVADKRRSQIYCQLIQICVSGLTPEKNQKVSTEMLNKASSILSKHQKLLGDSLIDPKELLFYQLLYPLLEMCVKSSSAEACLNGLSFLNSFFTQKFDKKNTKELQLAEHFLIHHKKALQKIITNEIGTEKAVSEMWTNRLKTGTKDLLSLLLENVTDIKHFELIIPNECSEDTELSIRYMLKWLEKIYALNQEGLMPQHKPCCDSLIKIIQTCQPEHLQLIFDFFHHLPHEKVNFNIPSTLIQSVYCHLYIRKFQIQMKRPSNVLDDVLLEFAADLWKLTSQTISEIYPTLSTYFSEIEKRNRDLSYMSQQYLLNGIIKEVATHELKLKKQEHEAIASELLSKQTPKLPPSKTKRKKGKTRVLKNEASTPSLTLASQREIHKDAVSNLFNLLFQSIQKVLPIDEVYKKKEMDILWTNFRDLKDHFDIKLEMSDFLHGYVQCCSKADSYDEVVAAEIVVGYLQYVPEALMTLDHLPHDKAFGDLLQKCILAGVKTLPLVGEEDARILFKNLVGLTERVLISKVDSDDKISMISALLCLLTNVKNKIAFAPDIYRIFKKAIPFYQKRDFLYWMHYYRLGDFEGKEPPTKLQNSKEQLEVRRQSLIALVGLFLGQNNSDPSAVDQIFTLLWKKDTVEFKGHFAELASLYDSVLDRVEIHNKETLNDPLDNVRFHRSLVQMMNVWMMSQSIKKSSAFSRVNSETGVREHLKFIDQQAHRKLMLKLISSYESICRMSSNIEQQAPRELMLKLISSNKSNCKVISNEHECQKREYGQRFLSNVGLLAHLKVFEIFFEEDLDSFGQILNLIYKFISDQKADKKTEFFSVETLSKFNEAVQGVFNRSSIKGKALESLKKTYDEQWAILNA